MDDIVLKSFWICIKAEDTEYTLEINIRKKVKFLNEYQKYHTKRGLYRMSKTAYKKLSTTDWT